MATIRYHHFARPGFLKRVCPDVLRQFLADYQDYLESRGLEFGGTIDCDELGAILATPDADTPADLIEALDICDAVSFPEVLEELVQLDNLRDEQLLNGEHGYADAVLLTWVSDPEAIERLHNRVALELDRSLHVYRANTPLRTGAFSRRVLSRLTRALRPMFENHLRGSSCKITAHDRPDGGKALVICHGDPIHKEEAIAEDTGETEPIVYRPERVDLAFYYPSRNEWRISGNGRWLQELYTGQIARTLHEEGCALARAQRFTLQPLVGHGLGALDHQTELVRDARLAELHMSVCGATMRLSGRDLHHAFQVMENPLHEHGEPRSARLAFRIMNRRSQLNVTIHEGKMTVKGDIDHPAVEDWLAEAGFLLYETDESRVLASN